MRKNRTLLVASIASVTITALGVGASAWVRSPQQQAAEAAPPSPSVLTVAVEKKVLTQSVVLRGDVVAEQSVSVTPTARGGGRSVVTAVRVKAGSKFSAGAVLLEVAGRPLFALPGSKPAYRDLRPGYTGDDIAQLQAALKSIGFDPGETKGNFGIGTKAALTKYYASIGYTALAAGAADEVQLAAAAKQVKDAERAEADAKDALAAAPEGQRSSAQKTLDRSQEDLAAAKSGRQDVISRTGPMLPLEEYVFLPTFPARVDATTAVVGADVKEPAITVSSGQLRVSSNLGTGQKDAVKEGMTVDLAADALGVSFTGKVTAVGELRTDPKDPSVNGYPLTIVPDKPLDQTLVGQNVRLSIKATSSDGAVLVVPLAALFSSAGGDTSVIRLSGDGSQERVAVTPGFHGDGLVAVTGELNAGDMVIIGVQQ